MPAREIVEGLKSTGFTHDPSNNSRQDVVQRLVRYRAEQRHCERRLPTSSSLRNYCKTLTCCETVKLSLQEGCEGATRAVAHDLSLRAGTLLWL